MTKSIPQPEWVKEFDKWFNYGTKKTPRFAYASEVYSEVLKFVEDLIQSRERALTQEIKDSIDKKGLSDNLGAILHKGKIYLDAEWILALLDSYLDELEEKI